MTDRSLVARPYRRGWEKSEAGWMVKALSAVLEIMEVPRGFMPKTDTFNMNFA